VIGQNPIFQAKFVEQLSPVPVLVSQSLPTASDPSPNRDGITSARRLQARFSTKSAIGGHQAESQEGEKRKLPDD
jgi:hypothetical protein